MSRIPQPSSSRQGTRSPLKPSPSPSPSPSVPRASVTPLAKPRIRTSSAAPAPSPSLRTRPSLKSLKPKPTTPAKSPAKKPHPLPAEDVPPPPKPLLSIREQIALKRAEAKKNTAKVSPVKIEFSSLEDSSPHTYNQQPEVDVDFGRWSIQETIERARSSGEYRRVVLESLVGTNELRVDLRPTSAGALTFFQGAINLSSRDLQCIPSALFEIHLGITPEPLKSVPVEPPITTSSSGDPTASRKGNTPSWYEAQDLEVLKAWSNEIVEIQSEISMFGSLKTIDLRNNKLTSLPGSFADLTALTNLDLSHNKLTSLPANLWALPHLTTLNLSHNFLTSLPFGAPFGEGSNPLGRTKDSRGDWFTQTITRATEPLPRLTCLDVSHNHLSASAIDHSENGPGFPALLAKLDLSNNPLGKSDTLFRALGRMQRLAEIHMLQADVGDDSFPVSVFSAASGFLFPVLKIFDLEETYVTRPVVEAVFTPNVIKQTVEYEVTPQEPPEGILCIIVGKRVIKEAWEIEAERRTKARRQVAFASNHGSVGSRSDSRGDGTKEAWEIEAEQGLLTEGGKRLARAQAAAASVASSSTSPAKPTPLSPRKPKVVEKEAWEIEAEQGLLSAGARRRARAAAVAVSASAESTQPSTPRTPSPPSHTPATLAAALVNPQYYNKNTLTLTLPTSVPPSKAIHTRSFSLASPAWSKGPASQVSEHALALPAPTLPLAAVSAQPLASTLKVLILDNRRADPSFSIPADIGVCLPCLEELSLANCTLGDSVPVSHVEGNGESGEALTSQRVSEPLLSLIAKLFPSLRTLDLSYNRLTSAALTKEALASLILADTHAGGEDEGEDREGAGKGAERKGLRQLNLRGNRLTELDGFQYIAERFKGNRDVPEWKLEELDLRDNEIAKLPPELGLLALDVFLVDGNTFRVPPRRVWEREGTKGLLSWLRGRIE